MKKKYRIIIAGSRSCPEKDHFLLIKVGKIISSLDYGDIEIVSGTARGADKFGEWFAEQCGLPIKRFPADWNNHGKKAGYLRNKEMRNYSNYLIAIWDGQSKGTKHMIDLACEGGLNVRVIEI